MSSKNYYVKSAGSKKRPVVPPPSPQPTDSDEELVRQALDVICPEEGDQFVGSLQDFAERIVRQGWRPPSNNENERFFLAGFIEGAFRYSPMKPEPNSLVWLANEAYDEHVSKIKNRS